jgi:gliding motility-associated-like protein
MKTTIKWLFILVCLGHISTKAQTNLSSTPFCFGNPQSIANSSFYTRAYPVDFEQDGDLDVVICDTVQHELKVFLNNGTGSFPTSLTQTITNVFDITIGQLVGVDTFTDIAVLKLDGTIEVFKNTSSSTTTASIASYTLLPPPSLAPVTLVSSIDAIDYNNDYTDDLFVTYYSQVSTITNYRYFGYTNSTSNPGSFTLESLVGYVPFVTSLVSADSCSVVFGDLNNDGYKDAVFSSGQTSSPSVQAQTTYNTSLFNGTPTIQTLTISTLAGPLTDMRIEDYNNDYIIDIGIYAQGYGFSVFKGNGQITPTFTETFVINPPSQGGKYLWKELNNDGKNEFLSVDKVSDKISINEGDSSAAQFKSNQQIITFSLGSSANFIVADFDGNGLNDILTSGDYNYSGDVSLIKNYSYTFKTTSNHGGIVCSSNPVTLSVNTTTRITNPSYLWSPTNQTTPAITTTIATVHYATITYTPEAGATCSITSIPFTVTFIAGTLPNFTITPQTSTICLQYSGDSYIPFSVSGVPNYSLLTSYGSNPNASGVNPNFGLNIYTIDGQDSLNGCVNTHTFSVLVLQSPIPMYPSFSSSNTNTTLCAGSPITLTVTCDSTKNYLWLPGSLTNSVITVNPTLSTTYTMIASNGVCKDTLTYYVDVSPVPIINASISSTNICTNQGAAVVNYSGTAGNIYVTTGGSGSYTSSSFTLNPTATTVYTITATNSTYSACPTTDSIFTINVNITPTVNVSPQTATVCAYYSTTLTANGADHYIWSTGATTQSTVINPYISVTIYTVTGQDVTSLCSDSKTITIYTKPLPIITASTNSTQVCSGGLAVLQAGGGTTYSWSPMGIISQNVSVFPTANSTYTVYGMGTNGCANFATVLVGVYPAQNINAYATPSVICVGESATLTVTGGTPTVGNYQNQIVSPTINTSYSVTIIDNNGCFYDRSANVEVNVTCATLVYNGFTPNGDGVNDFFYIDHIDHFTNNKVSIYNRWGNSVFETTNYNNLNNAWDGRVKGTVVPNGTYFYVINLNDGSEPKKGWLEVTGQ